MRFLVQFGALQKGTSNFLVVSVVNELGGRSALSECSSCQKNGLRFPNSPSKVLRNLFVIKGFLDFQSFE